MVEDEDVMISRSWSLPAWKKAFSNKGLTLDAGCVRSIEFKLHQARYHLFRILWADDKMNKLPLVMKSEHVLLAEVTQYEFDALMYALNSSKGILAKLTWLVYTRENAGNKRVYFSTLLNNLAKLPKKIQGLLESFGKDEPYVTDYCNNIKHRDALICSVVTEITPGTLRVGAQSPYWPNGSRWYVDRARELEERYRVFVCNMGWTMLSDMGYTPPPIVKRSPTNGGSGGIPRSTGPQTEVPGCERQTAADREDGS